MEMLVTDEGDVTARTPDSWPKHMYIIQEIIQEKSALDAQSVPRYFQVSNHTIDKHTQALHMSPGSCDPLT
jgi:hypothetical protein